MRANTNKNPIRHLVATLATLALVFTGTVVALQPANAVNVNACISGSTWSTNANCGGAPVALSPNVVGVQGTPITASTAPSHASCVADTNGHALFAASDTGYNNQSPAIAGLTFSASTGQLSGTPTSDLVATDYIIVVECTNASSVNFKRYSLTVSVGVSVTPATQTITGTTNSAITASATYVANNFNPAPSYAVRGGNSNLPAGLVFETTSGVIRGTPTATSSATITIDVANNNAQSATATVTFNITAGGSPLSNRVTICHRTHSETNPYVRITVNYTAVDSQGNSDHYHHDEIFNGQHTFRAGFYPRAKDKLWGDIIPPDSSGQNRWQPRNWTENGGLGQVIYNGTNGNTACPGAGTTPTFNKQTYFNQMREAGIPVKEIKAELEVLMAEQNDVDPNVSTAGISSITYGGSDTTIAAKDAAVKVTICHRTNALTNPYRRITVDVASLTGARGHSGHDEIYGGSHVFNSTANFYPTNSKDWGDIIPPDTERINASQPVRWQPLNWTENNNAGQDIYNNVNGNTACPAEDSQTLQQFYDKMREEGFTKKQVKEELESQQNEDDNPNDKDGLKYNGTDPTTENNEPKPPQQPSNRTPINQSLSGIVWLDLNRDGIKDPDEPLMRGISLSVVSTVAPASVSRVAPGRFGAASSIFFNRATATQVTTDANGYYEFPSLGAGYWRVVTTVPADLSVTYDSFSSSDGLVTTLVPAGSYAFTWVGLVGTQSVNQQVIDGTYGNNNGGGGSTTTVVTPTPTPAPTTPTTPVTPAPTTPATPVTPVKKPTKKPIGSTTSAASAGSGSGNSANELAFTGDNSLLWLLFGGLLTAAGAFGIRRTSRRKID